MKYDELERLYLKSFEVELSVEESRALMEELNSNPELSVELKKFDHMRQLLLSDSPQTFGPYFSSRLINKIQNTGTLVDLEIFGFFKKFQLAAVGLVVALIILNTVFTQGDILAALGLNSPTTTENEIMSFDYYEILNESL